MSDPSDARTRVAVVGAGVAGLACARTLRDRGLDVQVFDKGRHPGGRTSTRQQGDLAFDHGAQYFKAVDERFRRAVETWVNRGVAARWTGRIVEISDDGRVRERSTDEPRYVGVPGMQAVCGDLAEGLDVTCGVTVESIHRDEDRWSLTTSDGTRGAFDELVVAVPAPQAARLLTTGFPLHDAATAVDMVPCWAAMLCVAQPVETDFEAAVVHGSPLSWIASDGSKPGRGNARRTWVLHASADWSRENLEAEPDEVAPRLLAAFRELVGPVETRSIRAHRWRYALPETPLGRMPRDERMRLTLCGDWCLGRSVESAFLSGLEAADRIPSWGT